LLDDVRQYSRRREDFERNQMRRVAASRIDLEAMVPFVERRGPVVVETHRASDIQAVLRLAREQSLDVILTGAEEGWMVAAEIAAAKTPVILNPLANLPRSFEALGARLENAALLHQAGVTLAISARARAEHVSRAIRFETGNAVANGMPWEAALSAVTRNPAGMFGLGDETGTLAPGKSAEVVVWSGDPFEPTTRPRHVFIRGREIPLRSRQTELRDRYRGLARGRSK
jgi:imidazolonepropionase-like amidohydrolase